MTDLTPTRGGGRVVTRVLRALMFDALAERWDAFAELWDRIDGRVVSWCAAVLPDSAESAVDLGCGAGRLSVLLADRYPDGKVTAVDLSAGMLAQAGRRRSRPNIDYRQDDVLAFARSVGQVFDVVVCVEALRHLGEPAVVLRALRSLVVVGGTLVLVDWVDAGGWSAREYQLSRAFHLARSAYDLTDGDPAAAATVVELMLDRDRLDLETADVPLTLPEFREHCTAAFPGVKITTDLHPMIAAALWRNPGDLPRLRTRHPVGAPEFAEPPRPPDMPTARSEPPDLPLFSGWPEGRPGVRSGVRSC